MYDYDVPASRASAPIKTKLVPLAADATPDAPPPTEPVMMDITAVLAVRIVRFMID